MHIDTAYISKINRIYYDSFWYHDVIPIIQT
jgi:hypothetical protein